MTDFHIDATWKGVYKVGGLALVLADLFYLANCTLGFLMGSTPGNNLAFLQSLAAHPVLAQFIYWIYGLVDILFIPASLGLYLALKGINKNAMLIAAAILGFMIILDLGITELNTLALISLAQNYAAATSDAQRAVYLAAGN